jgi:PIN domain nuclease of toxin-antitoxin system
MTILDSSAVLALLFEEPGEGVVASALAGSLLSAVNLAEVLARLARDGRPTGVVREDLWASGVTISPFTDASALLSARIFPATRPLGLSLGDRACLALAMAMDAPVLTADRVWARLDLGVEVVLIR